MYVYLTIIALGLGFRPRKNSRFHPKRRRPEVEHNPGFTKDLGNFDHNIMTLFTTPRILVLMPPCGYQELAYLPWARENVDPAPDGDDLIILGNETKWKASMLMLSRRKTLPSFGCKFNLHRGSCRTIWLLGCPH